MIQIRKFSDDESKLTLSFRVAKSTLLEFRSDNGKSEKMWQLEGISEIGIQKLFVPFRDDTLFFDTVAGNELFLVYGIRATKDYKAVLKLLYIDF